MSGHEGGGFLHQIAEFGQPALELFNHARHEGHELMHAFSHAGSPDPGALVGMRENATVGKFRGAGSAHPEQLVRESPLSRGLGRGMQALSGVQALHDSTVAADAPDNGQYLNNQHWQAVGNAHLHTLGALPGLGAVPAGVELGLNTVGGLAGAINPAWGFGAGGVVGGVDHLLHDHPMAATAMGAAAGGVMGGPLGMMAGAVGGRAMSHIGDAVTGIGSGLNSAANQAMSWMGIGGHR